MNVIDEVKIDYSDVLLVPQRSKLPSRADVLLERSYTFPHSQLILNCVGVIAANMDTVGTFNMAREFYKHKMLVALHKHYSVNELFDFFQDKTYWGTAFYTVGTSQSDEDKLKELVGRIKEIHPNEFFPKLICIDIANGYSQHFTDKLREYRKNYPESIIMAGNICTANMAEELIISGADIAKAGIGGGCFISGTKVKTYIGYKNIEDICEGDMVLTHMGRYKKVVGTLTRDEEDHLYSFQFNGNEFTCTGNHEILVLNKKYEFIINDDNINEYTEWIEAKSLTKDYFLLEIKEE
jgi:GMP reductase